MKKIECYVLVTLIYSTIVQPTRVAETENITECKTPGNEQGICIPIRECTSLFNRILKGKNLTTDDRQYLTSSQCGYQYNQPFVCCPDFNTTIYYNIFPKPGVCGVMPVYRIYRGITADFDTYPWMALLEYSKAKNTSGIHCIGVLISKRYVLTAAHCVLGKDIPDSWSLTGVRLGEYDLKKDSDCEDFGGFLECNPPVVSIPISEKIIHEQYDSHTKNRANDIALLKLQHDTEYTDLVHPICLPRSQMLRDFNYDSNILEVVGWNKNTSEYSVKLAGRINPVETRQCKTIYNGADISILDKQMCGFSEPRTYDSCLGLPGSPIMTSFVEQTQVVWYLTAVEAFAAPTCGDKKLPNVYTRIISYIDWIESTLLSNFKQ